MRAAESANLTNAHIDFNRFGGLGWVHRTDGELSFLDAARLLGRASGTSVRFVARMLTHAFARASPAIAPDVFVPPDSNVARQAQQAMSGTSSCILEHSYRTWMLGTALGVLDGRQLDRELFYCAALLHDYGLAHPTKGRDFTLAGSQRAAEVAELGGRSADDVKALADGICVHPTVGISVPRDGAIGYYLQWGSMADIAGLRRSEIPTANLQEILRLHPRADSFKEEMAAIVSSETRAVPRGRFALYRHVGMTLAIRWLVPDWH